jgi:hypothetical protein
VALQWNFSKGLKEWHRMRSLWTTRHQMLLLRKGVLPNVADTGSGDTEEWKEAAKVVTELGETSSRYLSVLLLNLTHDISQFEQRGSSNNNSQSSLAISIHQCKPPPNPSLKCTTPHAFMQPTIFPQHYSVAVASPPTFTPTNSSSTTSSISTANKDLPHPSIRNSPGRTARSI